MIGANAANALTDLLYSGEHFDSRITQLYLRARYYDPVTGRFNRLDPVRGKVDDPLSLNKYTYAYSDPVQNLDPTGQFTLIGLMISVAIGGGIDAEYSREVTGYGGDIAAAFMPRVGVPGPCKCRPPSS